MDVGWKLIYIITNNRKTNIATPGYNILRMEYVDKSFSFKDFTFSTYQFSILRLRNNIKNKWAKNGKIQNEIIRIIFPTEKEKSSFLLISYRLHIAPLPLLLLPLPRVVEHLTQLWRDQAGLAVSDARAVELHGAEPKDGSQILP